MKLLSMLWGLLFLIIFSGQAYGQGNTAIFTEGKLYVKVFNQSNVELPTFYGRGEIEVLLNSGFEEIYQAGQFSGIYEIKKAFNTRSETLDHIYLVSFSHHQLMDQLIEDLASISYIEYAEKIPQHPLQYVPNDYSAGQQYYLDRINAEAAWDISQGSSDVVIAVIDAAVLTTHPDLAANIWVNPGEIPNNGIDDDGNGYIDDINGYDVSDNDNNPNPPSISHNHGTLVAGSASAVADNNTGIAGIGFSCKIMAVKATRNSAGGSFINNSGAGIDYAIRAGANIINMSYGSPGGSSTIQSLIDEGHRRGIIFVAAAGNDNRQDVTNFPAAYDHVISVGGTNSADRVSNFSTVDETIDIMAPGSDFLTTNYSPFMTPGYSNTQGTSFSSPLLAGVIGLMLSANPCLPPEEVEFILKSTAVNIDAGNPNYIGRMGAGRVDAGAALRLCVPDTATPVAKIDIDNLSNCDGVFQFSAEPYIVSNCDTPYVWVIDGQTYYTQNPLVKFSQSGNYSISLSVTNSGKSDQAAVNIPLSVGQDTEVDAGGDANGDLKTCFGQQHQLQGSANAFAVSYRWSPGLGLSNPNIINPILTTQNSTIYTLTTTDAAGCKRSDTLDVQVNALAVDAGPDVTIFLGDSTQLMPDACGNGLTYSWSPTTGLSDPTISNPTAKPSTTTTYFLTLTNSLMTQVIDSVTVEINPNVGLDKAFVQIGTIHLPYPNPALQEVVLSAELREAGSLQIEAYDLTGRRMATVFEEKVGKGSFAHRWNRDAKLASGVYLLVWRMNGAQQVQKVQLK